jgi:molybdopterin-containing oxidoreductase family iron-sulfur binding subunit
MTPPKNNSQPPESSPETGQFTRRDFTQIASIAAGGAAIALVGIGASKISGTAKDPTGPETVREIPPITSVPKGDGADMLVQMQEELRRALAKPVEQRHWLMVIDTSKCVGCHACTIACIAENKLPRGVVYRPVVTTETGDYPNLAMRFTPRPCMQCQTPACVPVCPVKATWRRPDGIAAINYDQCIGCGYCVVACPYSARTRDLGEDYTANTPELQPYEQAPNYEYGKAWDRTRGRSPVGNARKCQFCVHRLDHGFLPMCVTTCIGRANYFGDANDPAAIVNKKAASPHAIRLLEEKGTHPSVIYLI